MKTAPLVCICLSFCALLFFVATFLGHSLCVCFDFTACDDQHPHYSGVDVPFGVFSKEQIEKAESILPNSQLCTKTFSVELDSSPVTDDVVTIVVDFIDSPQASTTDIFGNRVTEFDITRYGFAENQFNTVAQAIMDAVRDDYFNELVGTPAKQDGMQLGINIIEGDIGVPPAGVSEYYFIQVGNGISGPHVQFLGVAGGSVVRNESGQGPNLGIQIGDVIGSVFTDEIQSLCCLNPFDALTSGNIEFTTNAIAGTLSHEIGHVLSLSHINTSQSMQPTPGAPPIMGTGAIDLVNQLRIADREFSLTGLNNQNGGSSVFQIQQLVNSVGRTPIEVFAEVDSGTLTVVATCDDDQITINPTGVVREVSLNVNGITDVFSGVVRVEVFADDGDDTITVNGNIRTELFGGNGDDVIFGSRGPDMIQGGAGMDELNGREGADVIYAAAPGMPDTDGNTIQGGRGADRIFGGEFADTIFGGEANDTIFAFAGDDDIFGGQGADLIQAGSGNDIVRSGESNDQVFGGPGNDLIIGGIGLDKLLGGAGDDEIYGGGGQDEINGGAGDDILNGNAQNDVLIGGDGDDTLTGGLQNDFLNGGAGRDTATDAGEAGEFNLE